MSRDRDEFEERIPLVEEQVHVDKREVETGRVRVRTVTDERLARVRDELVHGRVEVDRVPLDVPVDQIPDVRTEGDTIIVPVVEEVLVVEKRLILKEEVRIRRLADVEPIDQEVTLRSQHAVVEREDLTGRGDSHDPKTRS